MPARAAAIAKLGENILVRRIASITTGNNVAAYSHGGKIVENLVQAIARELLAAGLVKAWEMGLDVRMHVHDEIVALVKKKLAEISAQTLEEEMIEKPAWWGKRVPIRAKADIIECYQK